MNGAGWGWQRSPSLFTGLPSAAHSWDAEMGLGMLPASPCCPAPSQGSQELFLAPSLTHYGTLGKSLPFSVFFQPPAMRENGAELLNRARDSRPEPRLGTDKLFREC